MGNLKRVKQGNSGVTECSAHQGDTAASSVMMIRRTWHYDVDGGSRIPLETRRVAQHLLGLSVRVGEVPGLEPVVVLQCVDVMRQPQQSAALILHFQLQEVATAPQAVHTLLHVDHAHQ